MSVKLCLLLTVMVTFSSVTSSKMSFVATPTTIQHQMTDQLDLRCALHDTTTTSRVNNKQPHTENLQHKDEDDAISRSVTASEINFVSSIVILRNNSDVASISSFAPAKGFDNSAAMQVTGQVVVNGSELGYLQVTWTNPGPEQSGHYTCDITGFDQIGHPKIMSETLDVKESEVTVRDLMKYIQELKTKDKINTAIINNLTNSIQVITTKEQLNTASLTSMNGNIMKNANDINSCNNNFDKLIKTVNTAVIFSAGLSRDFNVSVWTDTIVFDQVLLSVGGGYNPVTGVFTCPLAGIYLFHVHVMNQADKSLGVVIVHNTQNIALMEVNRSPGYQASSNTVSVRLDYGDTVKVLPTTITSYLKGGFIAPTSTFTGQLVKPL